MANIPAPVKDIQFIADEVLDLTTHYKNLGVHEDIDVETFMTIVDEASKFLHEHAGPLNRNASQCAPLTASRNFIKPIVKQAGLPWMAMKPMAARA
jgi:hypothetical protein